MFAVKIIGIESSCDESAAAVIEDGRTICSNVVASQAEIHAKFGGSVPEVASRQHMITMIPVVQQALEEAGVKATELDGIAVTYGPGLAGSLLVGLAAAKALCVARGLPLIAVNHLQAHIYACRLASGQNVFPCLGLIVSGGHSSLYRCTTPLEFELLGGTIDDAAGEAFDKVASLLGLPFPGGPAIEKAARSGDPRAFALPRPLLHSDRLDFSFSGLKSAVLRRAQERGIYPPAEDSDPDPALVADIAKAFQEAIVDSMVQHTTQAAKDHNVKGILLGGGVAANTHLRNEMKARSPVEVIVPRPALCTDNGAMIGAAAYFHMRQGKSYQWDMDVVPNLRLG